MIRQSVYALAFTLAALAPTALWAHAVLLETVPADGAALEAAPAQLRLTFNEPVRPIFLRLIGSNGRQLLAADAVRARNATITATVPELSQGAYIVSWRAVSIDGHPIGGAFTFRIGAAPTAATPDMAPATEAGWLAASAVVRFLVYALTLLAAGGALFIATVLHASSAPAAVRRYVLLCAVGAAAALILSLGIEGGLLTLGPWTALFDPALWRLAAAGTTGASVALSLLGLAVIAGGLWHREATHPRLVLFGAIIAIAGFGVTGHAATAGPRWLTTPAVVTHGLVAAFWVGALWPLAWFLRHRHTPVAAGVIQRFSRLAVVAVALLVLAGTILAIVQVADIAALWRTIYGRVLLAKLAAVLGLLGLAGLNKWRLTPALVRNDTPAGHRLRRSIHAEMALAIAVLVATAVLGTVPPPRALAAQRAHADQRQMTGYSVSVPAPPYTALIKVTPARPGVNTITVHLSRDGDSAPVQPLQATLAFSLPAARIEPITRTLAPVGPGLLRYTGPELSLRGRWTLRVEALISDFEKAIFEAEVPIR
ncbi:MAG: CopD family protein [Nitrococcus sp.]|nr:CopD family protein [Nitrococcus sp.]